MSRFKVGDKVKVVRAAGSCFFKKGDVGIVITPCSPLDECVDVDFNDQGNKVVYSNGCWLVDEDKLELVKEET